MKEKEINFGPYFMQIDEMGKVKITKDGELVSNTTQALREIAASIQMEINPNWNTHQFGAKVYERLNQEGKGTENQKAEAPIAETPEEDEKLVVEVSQEEALSSKVRVYGKAQNRTALGIVHAYMVMYPHATLDDLRKAFPNTLNPDSGVKQNFLDLAEKKEGNWNGYFDKEDEIIMTGDGKKVAFVSMWTKNSFLNMVAQAKLYDIVIAKFEAADKGGHKGGFRLEYLNGYIPPVPENKKKKIPIWVWILLALLLIGCLVFAFTRPQKVVEVEKIVTVVDTVYVQQLEEIETKFNNVQYEVGKADLSEDAKFILHDLEKLMQKHPELNVKIVGHTSSEGDADFNQKLSEQRAKSAVDFLIKRGVDENRLKFEGKGSSEPIDENTPEKNRRTEFIVWK